MSGKIQLDFAPVPMSRIYPNEPLCTDVYIKVADKYIKFRHKGDEIDGARYNSLIAKSLTHLHIDIGKIPIFLKWLEETKEKSIANMTKKVGEEHRDLVVKREEISELICEVFADEVLTSSKIEFLQEKAQEFIDFALENKTNQMVFSKLTKFNASIADHSVNVANVSIFLGLILGHSHRSVLENLYMGALFHDYGKAKIPVDVLDNSSSSRYSQAIQDHPAKGCAALKGFESVSRPVFDIVIQHHEQHNGKGYPLNLAGDEIYGLSKVVALANAFDNVCQENAKRPEKEMYKAAIKVIEYDRGRRFDPETVPRVVEALKLSYAEYWRDDE